MSAHPQVWRLLGARGAQRGAPGRPAGRPDPVLCRHQALQLHSQHSLIITHDGGDCKTLLAGGGRQPVHFTATQHASELPFVDRLGFFLV